MPSRTEPKLIVGFLILLLAITGNVFVSSSNMDIVSNNRKWVAHTHQVISELEAALSSFKDAETGARGYVITGQDAYLEPYYNALQTVDAHLAALHQMTADNARQQHALLELDRLKAVHLALLQKIIAARRGYDETGARQMILKGQDKRTLDDIRALIARMENTENGLLLDRERQSDITERRTRFTFYGATVARMGLLCVIFLLISHAFAERRRLAESMQKREEWLSTTLHSIGDAVLATDEQGRVLFMNGIAEGLTGWKQGEAEGKDARDVFHVINEETRAEVANPIAKAIEHGIVVGLANHTVLIAKDGTERPIEDSGAPIRDTQGRLIGVVLVFRDVTERRDNEIERDRHVAELDHLNERLRRAMTETHHRVKNNLQVVAALIDMQEHHEGDMVPVSMLERLRQNIQALAVIHDILTEETKIDGEIRLVSIKGVLERLVPILRTTMGARRLRAEIEDVHLAPKQITALAIVANELISNAVKHGKGDIELTLHQHGSLVTLVIDDDGPGFPENFDPVAAANTGLELIESIARFDLHGETFYQNRSQGGAQIRITFPV
jgi:PAS domain S-box-containing protein